MDSHKLLGLVLDEQLPWNLHIDEVCSKVLKLINLLKAIKTYLPQCARQLFYKSLTQPIFGLCMCHLRRDIAVQPTDRILRLQKEAARVILNIKRPHDVPSSELFFKLDWMTMNQCVEYFMSILMFKTINKPSPNSPVSTVFILFCLNKL